MSIKLVWTASNGLFGTDVLPNLGDALRSKLYLERDGCTVKVESAPPTEDILEMAMANAALA